MNADDPQLATMVRELAGMNPADRDFVLGLLAADEAGRLAPYLESPPVPPLSEALRSLGAACADDRVPDGITARAAAAIDAAIANAVPEARIDPAPTAVRRTSFRSVISDIVAGR